MGGDFLHPISYSPPTPHSPLPSFSLSHRSILIIQP